nr:excinuclease ABC subunit UvrA [Saccharibacillus sp. O23]
MQAEYEELPYSLTVRSKMRLIGKGEEGKETAYSPIGSASDLLMKRNKHEQPLSASSHPIENKSITDRFFASSAPAETNTEHIRVKGAKQHNLKNVTVTIPHAKFVVITGVSGSGKSTLAFDIIHAEGQRRYLEHFGRSTTVPMEKPNVEQISGLSPTVAIEQKTIGSNPRSTVGSLTDIFDYLRLLFSRVGTSRCPECRRKLEVITPNQMVETLKSIRGETEIRLSAQLSPTNEKAMQALRKKASDRGLHRILYRGEPIDWKDKESLSRLVQAKSSFELVISRLSRNASPQEADRLAADVETALDFGKGVVLVTLDEKKSFFLCARPICPYCDLVFPELTPQVFSSNNPSGMCPECNGLGVKLNVDADKVIADPDLSLLDGASPWYGTLRQYKRSGNWMKSEIIALAEAWHIDLELPWKKLPERFREAAFQGMGEEQVRFAYEMEKRGRIGEIVRPVFGIVHHINRLFRETQAENVRQQLLEFMSEKPCPLCKGEKLCPEGRSVSVGHVRFPEVSRMTIQEVQDWIVGLPHRLSARELEISGDLLRELYVRLRSLLEVGLHYLSLERTAPTLSGGESQRIRLALQLTGGLINMCYVLDEPSTGLHPRDHAAMIRTLQKLKEAGNTVLVVEHDAATMRAADWMIDMGPGAGILGGQVIASGTVQEIMNHPTSATGQYLSGRLAVRPPRLSSRREPAGWLTIRNARMHNVKGIDVGMPVGVLTCVTGVSGSGKSTLVSRIFSPALSAAIERKSQTGMQSHSTLEGIDQIDKVITIDQKPIGRTPRSNPATYVEVFDEIRKCFADLPEAKAAGYKINHFSFNSKGGRCETCEGHGKKKIEMHFMPDVWVTCADCQGKRYNPKTLEMKYKGYSIFDVLEMDVGEASKAFAEEPDIVRVLRVLEEVGLSYIKLGQNALTLSGGEAQRIKLAKELSRADTGRTVYILDEPTTGLHFSDVQKLVNLLHRLVDAGNTVILVEHNMDVIRSADWIIDMGPEGGDGGGQVVIEGTPEDVCSCEESHTGRFLQQEMESGVYL